MLDTSLLFAVSGPPFKFKGTKVIKWSQLRPLLQTSIANAFRDFVSGMHQTELNLSCETLSAKLIGALSKQDQCFDLT